MRQLSLAWAALAAAGCAGRVRVDAPPVATEEPRHQTAEEEVAPASPSVTSGFGEAVDNLRCRVVAANGPPSAVAVRIELEYLGAAAPAGTDPHLLLPVVVDRNHLLHATVRRAGAVLPYTGPQPPADIGEVEDIVLTPGLVIRREMDLRPLFDFETGASYQVAVHLAAWSYETRFPRYWRNTLHCPPVTVRVASVGPPPDGSSKAPSVARVRK